MTDDQRIIDGLKKLARSYWDANSQPLLLSNLPPLFSAEVSNYKELLANRTLKKFIQETAGNDTYQLAEHPRQKAKVALLPPNTEYHFPDIGSNVEAQEERTRAPERALMEFLRALRHLPEADIAEVRIPVSVMVKMMK